MEVKNPMNGQGGKISGGGVGARLTWERPSLRRVAASDAEANMNAGMVDGAMSDMS